MAYRAVANEILNNSDLTYYLGIEEIPLTEIRLHLLNSLEREALESQGIVTLHDLNVYKNLKELSHKTSIPFLSLNKLTSAIDILIRGSKFIKKTVVRNKLSYIRIVFFGLNNAGKTSMIQYIRKKEPLAVLKEDFETRPTIGVDSSQKLRLQELPILLTELGGQRLFRETYVKDLGSYFHDTHIAVFVIDAQTPNRIDEALEYFCTVYKGLKQLGIKVDFKIAVHKTDEGVVESSQLIGKIISIIHEKIKLSVVNLIGSTYATTMFDPSSISNFFSQLIDDIVPIRSYVKIGLSTLNAVLPFEFCCIIDPQLSRLPLSWIIKPELDSKSIINNILIFTEELLQKEHVIPVNFTVIIENWIREMTFVPIVLIQKKFIFIYCFPDEFELDPNLPGVEELVIRAIEPQLALAFLAIETKKSQ